MDVFDGNASGVKAAALEYLGSYLRVLFAVTF